MTLMHADGPAPVQNSGSLHKAGHPAASVCPGLGCGDVPAPSRQAAGARHAGRLPLLHVSTLATLLKCYMLLMSNQPVCDPYITPVNLLSYVPEPGMSEGCPWLL